MNIVITGASRGIGYEIVKQLVEEGHIVHALSRNRMRLEALQNDCGNSPRLNTYICDVTDRPALTEVAKDVIRKSGKVNILINNAGAIVNKPFMELTDEDIEYAYNVNLKGTVRTIQAFLPEMDESFRAHIINIGSMGGFQGSAKFSGLSAYSSSKGAVACLTECLAEEFSTRNISFNCLALGAAQTEMLAEAFPGYKPDVTAREMAEYIIKFAINSGSLINGKVIPVARTTP